MDTRARTHIQAIAAEIKDTATDGSGTPAMHFTAGMLAGLAAAVEISDGATAEAVMERLATAASGAPPETSATCGQRGGERDQLVCIKSSGHVAAGDPWHDTVPDAVETTD
ncbi:hypothetical protein [Streptomyces cacaoi]|uniref:hypothetical protein n=1 Tax=Streptomyces cacaoi TaxID=1898 RepID=UPI00260DE922|nr:hypothetical protein [Streptomyces cacaoi]